MPKHRIVIPIESLKTLYIDKHFSPIRIGKIFNCDAITVRTRLKEYGIPLRSKSEAQMRYKKYDFSGSEIEKAYMVGFRLGDLNVYQKTTTSGLIVARCNTTQQIQIRLIKKMFIKYGRVTISPGKYSTNINCYLNNSFSFLLPKHIDVPDWIQISDSYASAFIAGYIDAEGNFLLNQNRARFKLDSYDLGILKWIVQWLNKKNVLVKFRCIAKKGNPRPNGAYFNSDLWRININEAISLLKFIKYIKPFIKHKTRLRDIMVCEKNIQERIKSKTIKYAN